MNLFNKIIIVSIRRYSYEINEYKIAYRNSSF